MSQFQIVPPTVAQGGASQTRLYHSANLKHILRSALQQLHLDGSSSLPSGNPAADAAAEQIHLLAIEALKILLVLTSPHSDPSSDRWRGLRRLAIPAGRFRLLWKCAAEILRTPLPFRVDLSADDEDLLLASVKLLRSEDVSTSSESERDRNRAAANADDELLLLSSLGGDDDDDEQNVDHEDDQAKRKAAGVDSARRMLKFLAQMSAVEPNLSHELLEELTFYYLRFGMYEEAYNRLQGYISSYPYNENARLVGYAGLVCYMLWRQEAKRVVDHAEREEDEGFLGSQTWGSSQLSYTSSYGWSQQTVPANEEAPSVQPEGDLASRHYSNAIQHFELSLFLDSSNDMVLFHYLKLMLAAGDVAAATTKITKFIEENPLNPNGYRYFLTLHHTTTKVASETWIPLAYKSLELDPVSDERVALRPLVEFFEAEYLADNNIEACQTIVNVLAARLDHGEGKGWMWRALGDNLARLRKVEASFHDDVWAERENWWPSLHFQAGAHQIPTGSPTAESEELIIYKATCSVLLFPARHHGTSYPRSFGLSRENLRPASHEFLFHLGIPLDAIFDEKRTPPPSELAIFAHLRPLKSLHEATAERVVQEAEELFGAWDQDVEDVCGMMALDLDASTLTGPGDFGRGKEAEVTMMDVDEDVVEAVTPRPVRAARAKRKTSNIARASGVDVISGDASTPTVELTPAAEGSVDEQDAGTRSNLSARRVSLRRRKPQPAAAAEDDHASDADDDATPRPARTRQLPKSLVVDDTSDDSNNNDAAEFPVIPATTVTSSSSSPSPATRKTRSATKAANSDILASVSSLTRPVTATPWVLVDQTGNYLEPTPTVVREIPRVVKRKRGTDEAIPAVAETPPAKRKRGNADSAVPAVTTIIRTPANKKAVAAKAKVAAKSTVVATPANTDLAQDRQRGDESLVSQAPAPSANKNRAALSKTALTNGTRASTKKRSAAPQTALSSQHEMDDSQDGERPLPSTPATTATARIRSSSRLSGEPETPTPVGRAVRLTQASFTATKNTHAPISSLRNSVPLAANDHDTEDDNPQVPATLASRSTKMTAPRTPMPADGSDSEDDHPLVLRATRRAPSRSTPAASTAVASVSTPTQKEQAIEPVEVPFSEGPRDDNDQLVTKTSTTISNARSTISTTPPKASAKAASKSASETPRLASKAITESTSNARLSATAEGEASNAAPKTAKKSKPKAAPRATPKAAAKATSMDAALKSTPKSKSKAAPRATPKTAPKVAPELVAEGVAKSKPKAGSEATPKAASKTATKAGPNAIPKATPNAASVGAPKATPKATTKATPKATPKAVLDATHQEAPKAVLDGSTKALKPSANPAPKAALKAKSKATPKASKSSPSTTAKISRIVKRKRDGDEPPVAAIDEVRQMAKKAKVAEA
ncbi:hypothetical protein HDU88_000963 [Geranomyces variabilis]|nr:hypothetical protein HDU88_000963 [Geranomyces variabilis]